MGLIRGKSFNSHKVGYSYNSLTLWLAIDLSNSLSIEASACSFVVVLKKLEISFGAMMTTFKIIKVSR